MLRPPAFVSNQRGNTPGWGLSLSPRNMEIASPALTSNLGAGIMKWLPADIIDSHKKNRSRVDTSLSRHIRPGQQGAAERGEQGAAGDDHDDLLGCKLYPLIFTFPSILSQIGPRYLLRGSSCHLDRQHCLSHKVLVFEILYSES